MDLVTLKDGTSSWVDVCHAASVLWRASESPNMHDLLKSLKARYSDPALTAVGLHTGLNNSRRGVVMCTKESIIITFEGSHRDELGKNLWTDGKGPNFWDLPYPVYIEGNRVHSFFHDMWCGMQEATFDALGDAVQSVLARGAEPKQIIVAGLAFTDLLNHIRNTYGSASPSPQSWATDSNLGSLVQHLTFCAVAAADQGYYTILNELYERYQIRAWDFMNHLDWTVHAHHFAFRSWRGHRYILPDAVIGRFKGEFGPQGHGMLGYLKAAEWMAEHGTDQVFHLTRLSFAIVNLKPLLPGHVLVSPRRVVPRFNDLSATEVQDLFATVQRVSRMVERVFGASALNIAIQDGVDAGQSVPHVHAHIIPRKKNDLEAQGGTDAIYGMMESEDADLNKQLKAKEQAAQAQLAEDEKMGRFPAVDNDSRKPRSDEEMEREAQWLAEEMAKEEHMQDA
ncbi:hypothetical protein J1614_008140 [Plenodomus biglobosus]|nr:hypothetical protein J1614_008140 [Plenodomus biglobosus]